MYWVILLFPIAQLIAVCQMCSQKIRLDIYYEIIDPAVQNAKKYHATFPPHFSFGYCCNSYSEYRKDLHYLMDYADRDFEGYNTSLTENIEELRQYIAISKMNPTEYDLMLISQYEPIIKGKAAFLEEMIKCRPIVHSIFSNALNDLRGACEQVYTFCIDSHHDASSYYERGLIYFDQGKYFETINDISKAIDSNDQSYKNSDMYLIEGRAYSDLGLYNEAIIALNKALAQDPMNKEALLERAVAYFETGDFDSSIEDFFNSGIHSKPLDASHLDFAAGFFLGAMEGMKKFGTEFFPSLLATARGLGSTVWLFATSDPLGLQISEEMYNACQNFIRFLSNHTLPEIIETVSPKLKALIYNADTLTLKQKGEYLGYLIAKNGVEIVATVGATKIYQEIRKANAVLTLEALSAPMQKTKMVEKALEWGEKHSAEIVKRGNNEVYIKTLRGQDLSEKTLEKTLHELGYLLEQTADGARIAEIVQLEKQISSWLGEGTRFIRNEAGDSVFISKDGLRCVRFDFNRPKPHNNPHAHVEIKVDGKWIKSGEIYPTDIPHN